jgi:Lrp/AsnC ligand binding domain
MFPNWERGLREVQKGLHAVGPSNKLTPAGNVRAFVQITTKSVKNVDALIRRMLKINNVVSVDLTIGLIDFMIIIEAPTSEAVHRAIDEIHHLREVEEAVTNLAVPSRLRSAIKAVRTRR